jgi:YD repeat-containing protein
MICSSVNRFFTSNLLRMGDWTPNHRATQNRGGRRGTIAHKTGDRLSKTAAGLTTGTYLYTNGTHRLASIGAASRTNDANGNTTGSVMGGETFGYSDCNRITLVQRNGATVGTYTYNAFGQRVGKSASFPLSVSKRYGYDANSRLLDEYGTSNRDYVWVNDLPVAVVDETVSGGVTTSTVSYVHVDGLGTPRAVADGSGTVIWQWTSAPPLPSKQFDERVE